LVQESKLSLVVEGLMTQDGDGHRSSRRCGGGSRQVYIRVKILGEFSSYLCWACEIIVILPVDMLGYLDGMWRLFVMGFKGAL
jgi:hypothetical protein